MCAYFTRFRRRDPLKLAVECIKGKCPAYIEEMKQKLEKKYLGSYKGFGLVAKEYLVPGTFIGEYIGKRISISEGESLRNHSPFVLFYEGSTSASSFCIASDRTHLLALINDGHTKESNCVMKAIQIDNMTHICLFTMNGERGIEKGEELLYNYGNDSEAMYWRGGLKNPYPYPGPNENSDGSCTPKRNGTNPSGSYPAIVYSPQSSVSIKPSNAQFSVWSDGGLLEMNASALDGRQSDIITVDFYDSDTGNLIKTIRYKIRFIDKPFDIKM